jgi:two-component system NtrC family sensor kinase
VLTYSSFLLKRASDQPELREDLEVIVRETKRCRDIVKGLLDFARQSQPEKRPAAINAIIGQAVRIVQNQLMIRHVQVKQNLQEQVPPMNVDANQIQQVLVNLLLNANDAIDEKGGVITISTKAARNGGPRADDAAAAKGSVEIKVSDTGAGIPRENLQKIFEPFFTTKGQKGTGLGLAVVWGIIEKHGGRVTVESEVGKGTTFSILLPVDKKNNA